MAYHDRSAVESRLDMSIDYAGATDRLETFGRAWETFDGDLIVSLFTEDAEYHADLFAPPMVAHNAIRAYWLDALPDDRTGRVHRRAPLGLGGHRPVRVARELRASRPMAHGCDSLAS